MDEGNQFGAGTTAISQPAFLTSEPWPFGIKGIILQTSLSLKR